MASNPKNQRKHRKTQLGQVSDPLCLKLGGLLHNPFQFHLNLLLVLYPDLVLRALRSSVGCWQIPKQISKTGINYWQDLLPTSDLCSRWISASLWVAFVCQGYLAWRLCDSRVQPSLPYRMSVAWLRKSVTSSALKKAIIRQLQLLYYPARVDKWWWF